MDNLTSVMHPQDPSYQARRKSLIKELSRLEVKDLKQMLKTQADFGQFRDDQGLSDQVVNDINSIQKAGPWAPTFQPDMQRALGALDTGGNGLGTVGTTTGGYLIRQDLEAPAYAIFLKVFPFFDYISHEPANGLVHTATQITTPESGYTGAPTSWTSEVATFNYVNGAYNRVTFPIAIFAQGRGVGLKELAAVSAGGVNYDPMGLEMSNAMIRLAQDVQYTMFQGNYTNAAGTAANEGGLYDVRGFDGLRGVLGGYGSFSGNNALQVDQGGLNITESIQTAAAKLANVGGNPSAVIMSMNSKQAFDIEQLGSFRLMNSNTVTAGVVAQGVNWANGHLNILPVPGSTMGTYNRTSDNAVVEDIYLLDEATVRVRYLYSDGFTVIQIPTGADNYLSMRYLIFGMFGMELAAPVFCAKIRRLAA